ncbi:fdxN element excision controlling factor protein [Frigoriglobus tundricola]|uniref:FdxN element excision controlling factor protein n=1 Tax=Frigoriglobus tundricola TaxID=2774151 RepID=A0A6M5YRM3_9BACT|nr:element excision factor XisI family protein [Frigoriglobus tundricola]QJW95911.1 fdxN element excision controlling factor protein [Frigoriglobus tundricola]
MGSLNHYRKTIRHVLEDYAAWVTKPGGPVRAEVVFDPVLDHFELVRLGWEGTGAFTP